MSHKDKNIPFVSTVSVFFFFFFFFMTMKIVLYNHYHMNRHSKLFLG